ncbi:aspartate aminotransferase [Rhodobacteraceae bacterium (ex Bugula neritina AB1)]|nr:aspartate aminotransferase [Rhodobacteraceae bacterium (ex Bugula neritina AB1)]
MRHTPWLAFAIDRSAKTPVFEQICAAVRDRTISGELTEGTRLPPTRAFAVELGVSRSTVVTAYEQLVAEGYLSSLTGSGYTICATGQVELPAHRTPPGPEQEGEQPRKPVPFEASQPDMRLFPHRQWAKAVSRVCRTNPQSMLVSGALFGNYKLRQAIAAHVAEWRGIQASAHQIAITAGSTDALEICMRALTAKGDTIGLEDPGYMPARSFAQAHGLSQIRLEIDGNGARLPPDGTKPQLVMLTPSQQYPLGGAMSPGRRLEFIRWAKANGTWIVEDDYDSEFRYAGRPIPAMAGFDRLNRTIYIGSFSKIFSNSLRLGYVILPETLLEPFRTTLMRFGIKASYLPQQALSEFMASGEFYRHLRRVRRIYAERRKYLIDRLTADFSDVGTFQDHQAGMQIVLHLNDRWTDTVIAQRAAEKSVEVQALSEMASDKCACNGLVLGFCGYQQEEMAAGLAVLRSCFDQA